MNNKTFDTCVLLIALALLCLIFGVISYIPEPIVYTDFSAKDMIVPIPDEVTIYRPAPTPEPTIPESIEVNLELRRKMGEIPLTCSRLVFYNEYRMFLTGYCAEECGWNYWTSNGTYCHRANWAYRNSEPTTCAIDRSYFSYGTMFYVPSEDRVYIAEDTGPGVRGMWIDTYQNDMEDVYSYNTRYETVWTVDIEYYTVQASNYDVRLLLDDQFLEGIS